MQELFNEEVSVNLLFDRRTKRAVPKEVLWQGRRYTITQVGLHHTYRQGRTLIHVFSVTDGTIFFRLEFDTETLHWRLREVFDGLPD